MVEVSKAAKHFMWRNASCRCAYVYCSWNTSDGAVRTPLRPVTTGRASHVYWSSVVRSAPAVIGGQPPQAEWIGVRIPAGIGARPLVGIGVRYNFLRYVPMMCDLIQVLC